LYTVAFCQLFNKDITMMMMMMMMSIVHDGVASWNCLCGHLRRHGNRCI